MAQESIDRQKDYYRILDVPEEAPQSEIEGQFNRLKRLYKPDAQASADDKSYAQKKLAELEEAYAVLSDPQRRAAYDDGEVADPTTTSPVVVPAPVDEEEILYCANHPGRETLLRCNKCNKPICMECAIQTPVGYRCRECVRGQQEVFFNAQSWDNPIAFFVGFVVSAIGAPLVGLLIGSFGFFGLLVAFIAGSGAGSILAQIIRQAVGRRRGRYLPIFALIGIILGVLAGNFVFLFITGRFPLFSLSMLLFTGLAIAAAYPQLR